MTKNWLFVHVWHQNVVLLQPSLSHDLQNHLGLQPRLTNLDDFWELLQFPQPRNEVVADHQQEYTHNNI